MDAIEFVIKYPRYIQEIRSVIRSEFLPLLNELAQVDPHDLVTPETWFPNENAARGYVWSMLLKETKEVRMIE